MAKPKASFLLDARASAEPDRAGRSQPDPSRPDQVRRFEEAVAASPNIVRCQSTTGQADYLMTVLAPDIEHYERLLHETIFKLPGVTHVRSSIVLREVKSEGALPIR